MIAGAAGCGRGPQPLEAWENAAGGTFFDVKNGAESAEQTTAAEGTSPEETAAEETPAEETTAAGETTPAEETTAAGETTAAEQAHYIFPVRTPVPFEEMSSENFDAEAMDAAIEDLTAKLTEPDAFEAICADYDLIIDQYDALETDYNLIYIRYSGDPSNDEVFDLYSQEGELLDVYNDRMCIAFHDALESAYGEEFAAYIGSETLVGMLKDYQPMTDEAFALSREYDELIDRYFDMDENQESQPSRPADYGELYLELLDNFIATAREDGTCENYAEYIYKYGYFRDYSPEDIEAFRQWAKDFAGPSELRLTTAAYGLVGGFFRYMDISFTEDELYSKLKPYLTSVSPLHLEAYEAMENYHLCDFAPSVTKMNAGYTTKLDLYGVPYIFNDPTGNVGDIQTLIHEFGHFAEGYNNKKPAFYNFDCIDVAEIDSQGMEMLMLNYADEIYGEDCALTARMDNVIHLLGLIVDGCIFDEFQQEALQRRMDGTLTTGDQVGQLFNEVESRYGQNRWGFGWYVVHHTFDAPFYYLSYATSAAASLGLLVIGQESGYDAAVSAYNELVEMGTDQGYSHTLETVGLPDPLTDEGCERLTEGLGAYIETLLAEAAEAAEAEMEGGGGYAFEE